MAEIEVERCPTGINGLDELLEGGFPRGRVILLAGKCGTGKTIFTGQFLYNGAVKYDEPGILVSLEQNPEYLRKDLKVMGFDLKKLEDENKLAIIDASLSNIGPLSLNNEERTAERRQRAKVTLLPHDFDLDKLLSEIDELTKDIGAKRIVIDSFSSLDKLIESQEIDTEFKLRMGLRKDLLNINYSLQTLGLTSLLISDYIGDRMSSHGIEEYMVDGVVTLHFPEERDLGRHLIIEKMRSTAHSEQIHGIKIVRGTGIEVLSTV